MCVAAPRSWSPPGSGWCRARLSQPQLLELGAGGPPQSQGCGSDLALPQFQGCRHAAKASCLAGERRWGVGRQVGTPSRGQQSSWGLADPGVRGLPPQALRLRKPDGRVWCVLGSSYPGATPEGAVLLAAGGEQTRQESQAREGSGQKPRSVSGPQTIQPQVAKERSYPAPNKERPLPRGGWIQLQLWIK